MNPGDEVIIPEPFYANYNGFSIASNVKVVPITTQIENDFALPEMEAFEKLITPRTKAIMICNPGNPTGVVYPREALMKLREIVLKHDLYLIADEVYREFVYDGEKHASVLGMEGLNDNVIVVDSVSKRFSACGARIGAVISRNEKVMGAIMKLAQARLSPPTLGQLGAQAAYGLPQSYYDGVISEYKNRRDFLKKALEAIPGVLCPQVNGAFYAIVRLPVDDTEKFCRWMLESFSHEGSTVMMAPAAGFYASDGLGRDEVRIAYVLNTEALEKAMICLAEGLKAYQAEMMMKQ
jgi:aspartate aminotransferase